MVNSSLKASYKVQIYLNMYLIANSEEFRMCENTLWKDDESYGQHEAGPQDRHEPALYEQLQSPLRPGEGGRGGYLHLGRINMVVGVVLRVKLRRRR